MGAENATSESSKQKPLARPTLRLGLAWAGRGWAEFGLGTKNKAPEPRLQDSETQRHGGPNKPKNLGCGGLGCTELGWAGLGWGGLGWAGLRWGGLRWGGLGWAGLGWAGLGWAGLGWAALGWSQKRGPEPTLQDSETQRHGGPKRAKNGPKPMPPGGRKRHI